MPTLSIRGASAALVALALVAGCANSDARAVDRTTASGGEVAAKTATSTPGGLTDSLSARADRGRIKGSDTAPIWLIEVSDFQCSFCKRWHDESFAAIDRDYVQTGKVRFAYLNYPVPDLHPHARVAAEAAMCASAQGKFWDMHSALFNTQTKWAKLPDPMASFDSLAKAVGVDRSAWSTCMQSHGAIPLIDADHDRTRSYGVQSTPTFFVGDRKIEGAYPLDTFRTVINEQLAKAKAPR